LSIFSVQGDYRMNSPARKAVLTWTRRWHGGKAAVACRAPVEVRAFLQRKRLNGRSAPATDFEQTNEGK
jgi:hypothetical protein